MSNYKYDNPDDAYQEALRRINKTKSKSSAQLNLDGLGLTAVPPEIGRLRRLKILLLQNNQLTTFPSEIEQLSSLTGLNLENNQLTVIPPEVGQMTTLAELNLGNNQLTILPPEIGQLKRLIKLDLFSNQLSIVPPEIGQLTELSELYLVDNKLTDLPPEIGQLTGLVMLNLGSNQLTLVPPEIGQLVSLEILHLGGNKLATIPSEISRFVELKQFGLNHNSFTSIPLTICQSKSLEKLWLNDNQLTTVPPDIVQLKNLEFLNLSNNPNLLIPPEILAQDDNAQAILDYLREKQEKSARPLNEAKLIFVGQGGVGKTSLVKRLLGQPLDEAENQTEGINIDTWSLDVERSQQGVVPITLNIWDFGGQEIMHATHQFFLTKRSLYLLVLDARQGEGEGRVEYWLALINSFAPEAPVLIIINKSDQHHLDINRRGLQEKYPAIKGFIRTSARTSQGIEQLQSAIANILAEMPHVDTPFPASWMQVKNSLVTMQKTERHFIPYNEYEDLCIDKGITVESSQNTLVRFLHDLGIVLNFTDDDRVRDTSVLNPNWVTDGIYALLNNPKLQKQYGLFPRSQMRTLLPPDVYPSQQRRFLLDMMLKFELAFDLPDRKTLLIPDLISKEQPDFTWDDAEALQFAYQYRVLPRSILHRFMVRQHHRVDEKIRWRTGVMLHDDDFTALVKADIKAATIRISIHGDGDRRQFLYSLRLEFAGIHDSIQGTKPQEVVPIPGHPTAPPIGYAYLEQLEEMGMETVPHAAKDGEVIMLNVQDLLNGVSTSAMRQAGLPSPQKIRDMLRAFDESEFYELLFELDVDQAEFHGSLEDQRRECVQYMQRHNRLADLVALIGYKRPRMDL